MDSNLDSYPIEITMGLDFSPQTIVALPFYQNQMNLSMQMSMYVNLDFTLLYDLVVQESSQTEF